MLTPNKLILAANILNTIRRIDSHCLAAFHEVAGASATKADSLEHATCSMSFEACTKFFVANGMSRDRSLELLELNDLRGDLIREFCSLTALVAVSTSDNLNVKTITLLASISKYLKLADKEASLLCREILSESSV